MQSDSSSSPASPSWPDAERQRAAAALRASEELFAKAFNLSPDSMVIVRLADRIVVRANEAVARLWGTTPGKIVGQPARAYSEWMSETERLQFMQTLQAQGEIVDYETVLRQADGQLVPFAISTRLITISDEPCVLSVMRDITERKRAEAELHRAYATAEQHRAQLQAVLDNVSEGVVAASLDGNVFHWNPAAVAMHGFTSVEEYHRHLPEFADTFEFWTLDGRLLPLEQWPLPRVMRGEMLQNYETRLQRINSAWHRILSYSGTLARNDSGEPFLAVLSIADITDRKQAEAATARLAAIVEFSDDAIIGKDLQSTITSWNIGAERLFGYSADEVVGQSIMLLIPPERQAEEDYILGEITQGKSVEHFETVRQRKDGSLIDVSVTVSPIKDKRGQITGASKVVRDITDRKQAEAALQAKTEAIETMSQQLWQAAKLATMGELAAGIAHELNNPLATVSLRLESLLAQVPADDAKKRALEIIEQETERMANLVANLLQFSRRSGSQFSSLNIREEIEATLELIQYHLRNRNITLAQQFRNELPLVQADRQQLRQLFLNLFTNAIDAMPEGGTLTIRGDIQAHQVVLEVSDTGTGIATEDLPHIFENFFTTKPEGKGTGLGLPICKRIAQEHGGAFDLHSEAGAGTTARITLPIQNGANRNAL